MPPPPSSTPFASHPVVRGEVVFPNEPSRFIGGDIERFLVWAAGLGASDITIKTGDQIFLEIHGKKYRSTRRFITHSEVMDFVTHMFGSESPKATLSGASFLDFAYEVKPERSLRYRFRVNATPINVDGTLGAEITARTIPSEPPLLSSLNIESEILANMAPRQGMIVIAGGTGSGKSTLLASIIRSLAEDPDGNRKILTYESPIEYVYDDIDSPTTSIAQSEIGKHLSSFVEGTRNALRRKPDIILVGEARDAETIGEAITASMTGHALYTTVHADGFAATIRRMVNVFPEGEKNARAVDIVSALRMVVGQRLVPSRDGRRIALREFVVMTDKIVDQILDAGVNLITATCRQILMDHGQSFLQDAKRKLSQGLISERVYREIAHGSAAAARDADEEARRVMSSLSSAGYKQLSVEMSTPVGAVEIVGADDLEGPSLDFSSSSSNEK